MEVPINDGVDKSARLRERIAALEADRSGLIASIRHMHRGRLDGRYLTDSIRAELARSESPGVLLKTNRDRASLSQAMPGRALR